MRRSALFSVVALLLAVVPAPAVAVPPALPQASALASTGAGSLDLFWRDQASLELWQQAFRNGGWREPSRFSGAVSGNPAAAGDTTGRLMLAVAGTDRTVRAILRTGTTWSAWAGLGRKTFAQPAVASLGGGSFAVVVRGTDDKAYLRTYNPGVWRPWIALDGALTASPAAAGMVGGGTVVAVVGANQTVYTRTVSATGALGPWSKVNGRTTTATPAIAVDPGSGRWHLIVTGTDGTTSTRVYTPSTRTWGPWLRIGTAPRSGANAVSWGAGAVDTVVTGTDGAFHRASFRAGAWSAFARIRTVHDQPHATTRVNVGPDGVEADADSFHTKLSADGRYAVFSSAASNLVPGDTNSARDLFVRDRVAGTTTRVSVATGGGQGNGDSYYPSISADGRYVAFESRAATFVPGDTNNTNDVFVHDRQTGETKRVSVASDGTQANDWSFSPAISANGRYVAFGSFASNLAPGETHGRTNVLVHDRQTGATTAVSVSPTGGASDGESGSASISADGRYVAFTSDATNLVAGDTNNRFDAFVRDRVNGVTTRVSLATGGAQANAVQGWTSISGDGRYVTFGSDATNLAAGDTNNLTDVFLRDRLTGVTSRINVNTDGVQTTGGVSERAALSADGRFIVFESHATNLAPVDTNGVGDVFVRDLSAGTTLRVSVATNGAQGSGTSFVPSISADGRTVAFQSEAHNLVAGDTNNTRDIFVYQAS